MDSRVIQESIDNENGELQNCHLKPFSVQSESVIETADTTGTDLSLTNIGPESIAYEIEKLIDVRKDEVRGFFVFVFCVCFLLIICNMVLNY